MRSSKLETIVRVFVMSIIACGFAIISAASCGSCQAERKPLFTVLALNK